MENSVENVKKTGFFTLFSLFEAVENAIGTYSFKLKDTDTYLTVNGGNEFILESEQFEMPSKKNLFGKRKPTETEPYWQRLEKKVNSCFICDRVNYHMDRYFSTFFYMLKDPEFRQKVESSKGFCMRHFAQLLHSAEAELSNAHREWFYPTVFGLMKENLARVKDDLDWLIAKYDYRNASQPWKNSQDALKRAMQKVEGVYPADPPYKLEK